MTERVVYYRLNMTNGNPERSTLAFIERKLDDKGRIFIPQELGILRNNEAGRNPVIFPGLHGDIRLSNYSDWERLLADVFQQRAPFDQLSEDERERHKVMCQSGIEVTIDQDGRRIRIPPELQKMVGLKGGDIVLITGGDFGTFSLWKPERWYDFVGLPLPEDGVVSRRLLDRFSSFLRNR